MVKVKWAKNDYKGWNDHGNLRSIGNNTNKSNRFSLIKKHQKKIYTLLQVIMPGTSHAWLQFPQTLPLNNVYLLSQLVTQTSLSMPETDGQRYVWNTKEQLITLKIQFLLSSIFRPISYSSGLAHKECWRWEPFIKCRYLEIVGFPCWWKEHWLLWKSAYAHLGYRNNSSNIYQVLLEMVVCTISCVEAWVMKINLCECFLLTNHYIWDRV